jgi:predicted RNase H-like nuclease
MSEAKREVGHEGSTLPTVAVGVDGARAGWVGASLHSAPSLDPSTWETTVRLFSDFQAVAAYSAEQGAAALAIDIPIGLPDRVEPRGCDIAARKLLPGRASCVFNPPSRELLAAGSDYGRVQQLVAERRETEPRARCLSRQSVALIPKIAEVDAWVRAHPASETWLFECHPELTFAHLRGGDPAPPKHSSAGAVERLRLLRVPFPDLEDRVATLAAPTAGLADSLDAYAALSTALRCLRGEHHELGNGRRDSAGVPMRIVF